MLIVGLENSCYIWKSFLNLLEKTKEREPKRLNRHTFQALIHAFTMTLQCCQLYGFTAILCIRANYVNIISGFMFVTVLRLCCNVDKSSGLYSLFMQHWCAREKLSWVSQLLNSIVFMHYGFGKLNLEQTESIVRSWKWYFTVLHKKAHIINMVI